jgi:hypothetical protein
MDNKTKGIEVNLNKPTKSQNILEKSQDVINEHSTLIANILQNCLL